MEGSMSGLSWVLIVLAGASFLGPRLHGEALAAVPEATPPVDLERYVGKWWEIARFPMWFQRGCVHSWATYSLAGPDSVEVLNECLTDSGKHKTARGIARVVDKVNRSKLEVVFDNWFSRLFPFLTKGKYWIFYIDPGYQLAVVGDPARKYLWFLSRSPDLDDQTYLGLIEIAEGLRFDTKRLLRAKPKEVSKEVIEEGS
jgi:apolipoprotein D and lipocalin family protein